MNRSRPPILVFPELWPDETIYSLLAKIASVNGVGHFEVIGLLLGADRPTTVIGCPVDLRHFYEAAEGAYGSPNALLRKLTILPMLANLGVTSTSSLTDVEKGNIRPELGALIFGINRGCQWRICSECADRDRKIYGIAYWHKVHQLPTSQYCPEHQLKLVRFDLRRMRLHDHLFLPHDLKSNIVDTDDHPTKEIRNILLDISLLGRDALADDLPPYAADISQATFKQGLERFDILKATGELDLQEYFAEFARKFGTDASASKLLRLAKASKPSQLLNGLANDATCKPFGRLLLVNLLYETWSAFKEQCKWQDVMNGEGNHIEATRSPTDKSAPSFEVVRQYQRTICVDYKAAQTHPTRYEFMRIAYRAFRWLHQNDRGWLDEELPVMRSTKGQRKLFNKY